MSPDRRKILEQVASGELSPEEAESALRDLEGGGDRDDLQDLDIRRVKVSAGVGAIEVVGDPTVAQAEIDGPHQAEVEGDTLVVRADIDPDRPGAFAIRVGGRRIRIHKGVSSGSHPPVSRLRIRMNPDLELETHLDAGPLSITGIRGPIRARVSAGPLTIEDFTGPLDIAVNAGAIRANGRLTTGESRVRSDAGAVRIELDPSSSVRIIAQAALGKVVVPGSEREKRRGFGGDRQEAVIGEGEATLRVETAMGSVHVSSR